MVTLNWVKTVNDPNFVQTAAGNKNDFYGLVKTPGNRYRLVLTWGKTIPGPARSMKDLKWEAQVIEDSSPEPDPVKEVPVVVLTVGTETAVEPEVVQPAPVSVAQFAVSGPVMSFSVVNPVKFIRDTPADRQRPENVFERLKLYRDVRSFRVGSGMRGIRMVG